VYTGLNEHVMKMNAEHYTPVSDKLIPTGEIAPVQGTVFDLRQPTRQGEGRAYLHFP
jgi:aldose 1-epimerase